MKLCARCEAKRQYLEKLRADYYRECRKRDFREPNDAEGAWNRYQAAQVTS